jgi:hypothetical protein
MELASKEVFIGSYVDYSLPVEVQMDRYSPFLKSLAKTFLADPVNDQVSVALIDATDERGNITRLTEDVYKEFSASMCQRPQFSCVSRADVLALIQAYDVQTSNSIGRYLRRKIAKKFKPNLFMTLVVKPEGKKDETVSIKISTYNLATDSKMQDFELKSESKNYNTKPQEDEMVVKYMNSKQGLLKIALNRKAMLNGRWVDNLFMLQMEDYIPKKQWKYIPDAILNVDMMLDGKSLKSDDQGVVYYYDIITAGAHSLILTVSPTIAGRAELPLGKPIEKTLLLNVAPDIGTETEVVVKIYGKQAVIVVDTNKMKEQVLLPIDFP